MSPENVKHVQFVLF